MNPSQKQAIEAKAEELYPLIITSGSICMNDVNMEIRQSRKDFISGATFGLPLAEKRIKELEEAIQKSLSSLNKMQP